MLQAAWAVAVRQANSGRDLGKYSTSGAMSASMGNILGKNNTNSSTTNPFAALAPAPVAEEVDDFVTWTQTGNEVSKR